MKWVDCSPVGPNSLPKEIRLDSTRRGGQHQGLPTEFRQVLREAQGALNPAAPRQRREVVGDHEYALHDSLLP